MPSAVITGAGIGGLAAALALHRGGWRVTVIEERTDTSGGAGIVLAPNGLRALAALGIAPEDLGGAVIYPLGLRRPDGRWLQRLPAGAEPTRCLPRARLVDLLRSRLPLNTVRDGVAAIAASSTATGATLHTSGGDMAADLVVAADGVRSAIRRQHWPAAAQTYAGYVAWRGESCGLLPADLEPTGLEPFETWGRGVRVGVVPMTAESLYVYVTAPVASPDDIPNQPPLERFADWHSPMPTLLAQTRLTPAPVWALRRPPRSWHRGRIVLLGDAAHAMEPNLGQGGSAALEDAVTLAVCLAGGSTEKSLTAYTAARRPRTAKLLATSRTLGRLSLWSAPPVVAVRDALIAATPAIVTRRQFATVSGWQPSLPPRTEEPA